MNLNSIDFLAFAQTRDSIYSFTRKSTSELPTVSPSFKFSLYREKMNYTIDFLQTDHSWSQSSSWSSLAHGQNWNGLKVTLSRNFHINLHIFCSVVDLQLKGYNGRNTPQCKPDYLGVLAKLCPKIEKMHLSMTWPESFLFLSRFRNISHLSVFRVASVENFDLPLMVKTI